MGLRRKPGVGAFEYVKFFLAPREIPLTPTSRWILIAEKDAKLIPRRIFFEGGGRGKP